MSVYSYIHKRNADLIFSAVQPPMKIRLWNVDTFEHLNRTLNHWLDGDIADCKRIVRIQWLDTMFNQNGEVRFWLDIKTDIDIHMIMYTSHKIALMVVIA